MTFMEAYKRLEKLCGDIMHDDRCVSAYIEEMETQSQGAHLVPGWAEDIKQLKHYRRVRNQIAHDPSCSEENMCSDNDAQWILAFYARIMNQLDPLALYRKAVQMPPRMPVKKTTQPRYQEQTPKPNPKGNSVNVVIAVLLVAAVTVALLWLLR